MSSVRIACLIAAGDFEMKKKTSRRCFEGKYRSVMCWRSVGLEHVSSVGGILE